MPKDAKIDHRMLDAQLSNDEQHQPRSRQNCQHGDEVRREPIFFLSFVQHHLQRADAHREHAHAPIINFRSPALDVRRIKNKNISQKKCQHSDRYVDVEDPAPAVTVRQPAAENRPQHGRNYNSKRPEGHGFPAVFRRKHFQQNRLRERLQSAAGCALNNAKDDKKRKIGREAAEK